jgi:hypothetical protein
MYRSSDIPSILSILVAMSFRRVGVASVKLTKSPFTGVRRSIFPLQSEIRNPQSEIFSIHHDYHDQH